MIARKAMMMSFCNMAGLARIDFAQYRKLPSIPRHGAVNGGCSEVVGLCHISLFRKNPLRMSPSRMSLSCIGPLQIGPLHIGTIV